MPGCSKEWKLLPHDKVFWLEQRSRDVPAGNEWLAPSELSRLAAMRFVRRREDWRLGRWTAKHAVLAYLDLPGGLGELPEIEIRPSAGGAPEAFLAGRRAAVAISLSHRMGVGFCAVAPYGTMLGCDIEAVEPRGSGFVAAYFTPEEQDLIRHTPRPGQDELIALLWSAKESVLKALGVGLRRATTDVLVHPAGNAPPDTWGPLCAHTVEGGVFHGWHRDAGSLVRTVAVAAPGGACVAQA